MTPTPAGQIATGHHIRDRLGPIGRAVIDTSRRLKAKAQPSHDASRSGEHRKLPRR